MSTPTVADFDASALANYLSGRVEGILAPLSARRFDGGQSNPTYLIVDGGGRRYVLRRKPGGDLLPSAHAIDREYRVVKALEGTEVPVARMYCYCDDASVIGTHFYLMEFVDGRIFWDPALPELEPVDRSRLYDDINRVVAALHQVDIDAVGLRDFGKSGSYFERQINRWTRQYRAAETESISAMDSLIDWLPANVPKSDRVTLVHGDLRIDNMIIHPTEPRVVAVIDWELSTIGHPVADLAYHALPWRLTSGQFRGMAEKNPLPAGIPTEQDYVASYVRRTGVSIDRSEYEFGVTYGMFRMAAILQGIFKRSISGNAASSEARAVGAKARVLAEIAWAQVGAKFTH